MNTRPAVTTPRQPYTAPRLQPVGRWENVTLIQSVPINPRIPTPWNQKKNDW
ncbi:hypothetical protein GCM10008956_23200 [Deinococcus arenae]|uniref:Uncharacterized protein n=1 Tax=Deinococcus arenae TaxID=1452751 RepID=A0A8H9GQS9_9DEIO|nr:MULTISPECIES: hypothetical protein [Deinococcus]GGM46411.1 hypothetical protein GCM10008956_23200 [Deinococcus arenae]